ncbi:hypothetical protein NDU88_003871 [Pleurodeles waltl]|uniref:Uncharacterized protein n=1 Tax=Pleurodeles waltl TaxID=8319 RepID=A0AAV7KW84_PLEWA|nr:hypothetical protein NDU88_003871 [Pleurodeles waltl]
MRAREAKAHKRGRSALLCKSCCSLGIPYSELGRELVFHAHIDRSEKQIPGELPAWRLFAAVGLKEVLAIEWMAQNRTHDYRSAG